MNELQTITSAKDIIFKSDMMLQVERIANIMASSGVTIPKHLQGNKGDCFAIALQSLQWGMNPFSVAQKTHLVSGVLGYEAQLVNAVITSMAPTTGRLELEWFGDWSKVIGNVKEVQSKNGGTYRKLASTIADEKGCGVKVWATLQGESKPRVLELLLIQASVRNSTLWADDPKQQLAYLAIKRWSRLYCPDVIMGVYTRDELEEMPVEKEINPIIKNDPVAIESGPDFNETILSIEKMDVSDFKSIDPNQFNDEQKKQLRAAMTARKKAIKEASVVETVEPETVTEPDWEKAINECGDGATLTALLAEMPEKVKMVYEDLINDKFDAFIG
jgi:hypothetical protein